MSTRTPPAVAAEEPNAAAPGDEDGSLVTEYGLLAIVAATVAAGVIQWASDGAITTLFNALLRQARGIVGA
jgi:Flp pilus assembly pilin Flp